MRFLYVRMKDLKKDMVVVNREYPEKRRLLVTDAQPTHKGYYRAETAEGEPVNVHGSVLIPIVED